MGQPQSRPEADEWARKAIQLAEELKNRADADAKRDREEKLKAEAERDRLVESVEEAKIVQQREPRAREAAERKAAQTKTALERAELELERLDGDVRPIVDVTVTEIDQKKMEYQFKEGVFHIAVAGCAGSGKSSLINALRGLSNHSPGAAPADITETTSAVTRYPDPNSANRLVWYDVPGTGTLDVPDWEYFNDQGLYVFNAIIVLFDSRFTEKDLAIIRNCVRFKIPIYIVRSKSRQHIRNLVDDMPPVEGDDEAQRRVRARQQYIEETREKVNHHLELARLPRQPVYLVDKQTIVQVVSHAQPEELIDEQDLLRSLVTRAKIALGIA
ncbi:P-loop containing nucleoside triphosphate hydrolase protein [Laetiporus sulphureus 93-53]|uniref:p-loop containing nucleoside triphosphate hydrolase protein n=1 Tax=Laetiporus sulphureus 93-53 TaxID=1314785 RepID=A0A165C8F9_9APHY|nr:P-loop containing nucleoside triphosphate hydrolase protein [Laetiporus sulphureus 93-53]KZT02381.1 P-loop containing nucleoside triphosphate hydrolase protein [Laetiporus sulphureus 93-53]